MKKTAFSIRTWLLGAIVALLLLTPICLFLFFFSGHVMGEEFSPDDFTRRRFSYNVVPWINYTLRGIEYDDTTPVLEQTLVSDGLISPFRKTGNARKKWNLIYDTKTPVSLSSDFDAAVLCRYLDLSNPDGENVWLAWNSRHSKLAGEFWPVIQELAQNEVYWAIPPIMRQALSLEKESDPVFSSTLSRAAASGYIGAARECQEDGDHGRAIKLFSLAIDHQPSPDAFRGRAKSYRQTGDQEKSLADEQRARFRD
ncbi:MAG: hypothetical protein MK108_06365 [Mariniblastus sp.]|nr:hypothetical protein [Mariniblastus sp.]